MKKKEIIIELSNKCNLNCSMCGFGNTKQKQNNFMSFDMYKNILSKIHDKTNSVRFNGRGEQTIHPQFSEIITWTKTNCPELKLALNTNGMYDTDCNILKDMQLYISIDSLTQQGLNIMRSGADLIKIMGNIRNLHRNPKPCIIFTLQEYNMNDVDIISIADYCAKKNLNLMYNYYCSEGDNYTRYFKKLLILTSQINKCFNYVINTYSNKIEDLRVPDLISGVVPVINDKTIKTIKQGATCKYCYEGLFILYNGDVNPCGQMNPVHLGNIITDEFETFASHEFLKIKHPKTNYCEDCSNIMA